ncbi:hypothetical protein A9Z42_0011720 [Trichoderma parareesei]|uniref:Uncharacterized protein n=1 Tax=Trichoderma parareesei TaxID=858221 RepID=A0A2H2Z643_TRIPA|nr:hypothetical protein A9Z42_0011720 [Trichoderma parareesei]
MLVAILITNNIKQPLDLIHYALIAVLPISRARRRSGVLARVEQAAQAPKPTPKVHAGNACGEQAQNGACGPAAKSAQLLLRLGRYQRGRAEAIVGKQGASERPKDGRQMRGVEEGVDMVRKESAEADGESKRAIS